MNVFDPYFASRLLLAVLFFGFVIYDVIDSVLWYRQLPRFVQKLVLLKLLQLRSRTIRMECATIIALLSIQGILMFALLSWEN